MGAEDSRGCCKDVGTAEGLGQGGVCVCVCTRMCVQGGGRDPTLQEYPDRMRKSGFLQSCSILAENVLAVKVPAASTASGGARVTMGVAVKVPESIAQGGSVTQAWLPSHHLLLLCLVLCERLFTINRNKQTRTTTTSPCVLFPVDMLHSAHCRVYLNPSVLLWGRRCAK